MLSHVERDQIIKCQKGTCKGILSNACTVSSVTALSHPQKKQGQEKTPVKHRARTIVQYSDSREYTVGAIENIRSLRSEMPLALIPAGLLEPLPGRDAEHQNDPIAFSKRK